jgi:hypothetical protein
MGPLLTFHVLGRAAYVTPVKLLVGGLLLIFGLAELFPQARAVCRSVPVISRLAVR